MDELYEIVHQVKYWFFGIYEVYKLVIDEMYETSRFIAKIWISILRKLRCLSCKSKKFVLVVILTLISLFWLFGLCLFVWLFGMYDS